MCLVYCFTTGDADEAVSLGADDVIRVRDALFDAALDDTSYRR